MATTKTFFRFLVGSHWVCVEDGGGYLAQSEPPMYDHVAISIRPDKNGKPGSIESRTLYARRDQIASIAMQFLVMAHAMTPRTMYQRSEIVGASGQEPKIVPRAWEIDQELLNQFLDDVTPKVALAKYDQLRRRAHIVQSCVHLLERMSDQQASEFGKLVQWLDDNDGAMVSIQTTVVQGGPEGAAPPTASRH